LTICNILKCNKVFVLYRFEPDITTTRIQGNLAGKNLWSWCHLLRWVKMSCCCWNPMSFLLSVGHTLKMLCSTQLVYSMDFDHFYYVSNNHERFMVWISFYVHVLPLICRYHRKSGEILTTALYGLCEGWGCTFSSQATVCYLQFLFF
jgi:hypothetical protein